MHTSINILQLEWIYELDLKIGSGIFNIFLCIILFRHG
jgi:hypothetical protein